MGACRPASPSKSSRKTFGPSQGAGEGPADAATAEGIGSDDGSITYRKLLAIELWSSAMYMWLVVPLRVCAGKTLHANST